MNSEFDDFIFTNTCYNASENVYMHKPNEKNHLKHIHTENNLC